MSLTLHLQAVLKVFIVEAIPAVVAYERESLMGEQK